MYYQTLNPTRRTAKRGLAVRLGKILSLILRNPLYAIYGSADMAQRNPMTKCEVDGKWKWRLAARK
jgi:hypothetical protein